MRSQSIQWRLCPAVTRSYGGLSGASSALAVIHRRFRRSPPGRRMPASTMARDQSTASRDRTRAASGRASSPLPASEIQHAGIGRIGQQSRQTGHHLVRHWRTEMVDREHGRILKLRGVLWSQVRRFGGIRHALPSVMRWSPAHAPRRSRRRARVDSGPCPSYHAGRFGRSAGLCLGSTRAADSGDTGGVDGDAVRVAYCTWSPPVARPCAGIRMIRRRLGKRCRIGPRACRGAPRLTSPEQRVVRAGRARAQHPPRPATFSSPRERDMWIENLR